MKWKPDIQGQSLIEFCFTGGICTVALLIGIQLFADALRRHECAVEAFQRTRGALNQAHRQTSLSSPWNRFSATRDGYGVTGTKHCTLTGEQTEEVRLGLIPRKHATIMDLRVFRTFFSSESSPPEL